MILTCRYRIKDRNTKRLNEMAQAVNFVWNFCGDTQNHARRWSKRWPSAYDLMGLMVGSTKALGLNNDTVQAIAKQFAASRNAARRRPRWRGVHSLGWLPFQAARAIQINGDTVTYLGHRFRFWKHRPIGGTIKCGSFSRDASGRWYLNLQCDVAEAERKEGSAIGIDLGLKTLATCSDGTKIENPRHVRTWAERLAKAQRAGRRRRVRAIHRKVANARGHHLHVTTTTLIRKHAKIVVGNVNSASLAKTKMAKSVMDASWSLLRRQLRYKAIAHGVEYVERDERYTTQTCSECGCLGGPKGRKGLAVREWMCGECGAVHDRDVNAARNILGPECRPPLAGIAA